MWAEIFYSANRQILIVQIDILFTFAAFWCSGLVRQFTCSQGAETTLAKIWQWGVPFTPTEFRAFSAPLPYQQLNNGGALTALMVCHVS